MVPAMRQLLLLRHAKSSWDDPALSDHSRPLNARGRRAAAAMAAAVREMGLAPGLVLVSSARRTLQTLDALGPLPGAPAVEATDDLYLAPWTALLSALRAVPAGTSSVLLVAHNPGLHDLALALCSESGAAAPQPPDAARRLAEGYPTGTLCELSVAAPWAGLEAGGARLVRLLSPGDLPEMAG